jgi:mannose-6-phosphate isomerase-like protein (cupin superfamily)
VKQVFELEDLVNQVTSARSYREFLRIPSLSAGIYVLAPGAIDQQSPHREDEIYYVVRGDAKLRSGASEQAVKEGSMIFVEAGREHRFVDITEQLVLLVVFAPAETMN